MNDENVEPAHRGALMLRLHTRRARLNRPALDTPERCVAPADLARSPLLSELVAMRDHAVNLGWCARRELPRPDTYQHVATEVIGMLLQGWREQVPDGSLADLTPRKVPHEAVGAPGEGRA